MARTGPSDERPRKTKLEKIAELESGLKLLKEENRIHKKEIKNLKGLCNDKTLANPYEDRISNSEDVEKMKTALKSLKRVTIKQERSLQSMRESTNERRRQLVERDDKILKLKDQLRSMEKTMKSIQRGESNEDLHERVRELEMKHFDEKQKNLDLRQRAEKSEALAKHLEKKMSMQQTPCDCSSRDNSSNTCESDLTRMKQELAKRSSRVVCLEYELETTKEELVELRRQTGNNSGSFGSLQSSFQSSFQGSFTLGEDGFPCGPPIGADPFKPTDPFYGSTTDDNLFASNSDED